MLVCDIYTTKDTENLAVNVILFIEVKQHRCFKMDSKKAFSMTDYQHKGWHPTLYHDKPLVTSTQHTMRMHLWGWSHTFTKFFRTKSITCVWLSPGVVGQKKKKKLQWRYLSSGTHTNARWCYCGYHSCSLVVMLSEIILDCSKA